MQRTDRFAHTAAPQGQLSAGVLSVKKLIERNPKTCFGCCRNQDHRISFQGERLVFETAPPPTSIYWDNLGQFSACGLFCRRVGFWLLMLFVGCGFCAGYYFAIQKVSHQLIALDSAHISLYT